jgi:hypothetical protein
VVFLDMAYRSFREVLAGLTPASIRRLHNRRHPDSRIGAARALALL